MSSGTNIIAVIAQFLAGNRGRLVLSERNVLAHGRKTLKRLLDDGALRERFSEKARKSAERFRVDLVLENYVAALMEG